MKELNLNEIENVSGGCSCWCRHPFMMSRHMGYYANAQECANKCKKVGLVLEKCN